MKYSLNAIKLKTFSKIFQRYYSSKNNNTIEKLTHRSLIEVHGKEAAALLQGLVTNDVNHLETTKFGSLYAMFLNNKGRVMYDTIIYKIPGDGLFYVEVDKSAAKTVQKHINMYRLRRDVTVEIIDDKYDLWVNFNPDILPKDPKQEIDMIMNIGPCVPPKSVDSATVVSCECGDILEFGDPRISVLGSRVISSIKCNKKVEEFYGKEGEKRYKKFRYRLGVPEGIEELPTGNCFPLEANCDYLHGVSFHKGCYLGQELTARSHHTGVIRKRYMPIYFDSEIDNVPAYDEVIKAGDKNVGKLRGCVDNLGLALLRIGNVDASQPLLIKDLSAFTVKPFWWPKDKTKQDLNVVQM